MFQEDLFPVDAEKVVTFFQIKVFDKVTCRCKFPELVLETMNFSFHVKLGQSSLVSTSVSRSSDGQTLKVFP